MSPPPRENSHHGHQNELLGVHGIRHGPKREDTGQQRHGYDGQKKPELRHIVALVKHHRRRPERQKAPWSVQKKAAPAQEPHEDLVVCHGGVCKKIASVRV